MLSRGNATSGAPICSGMIALANPANSGVANSSSMSVPCMVNIWLYCSAVDELQARLRQLGPDHQGHQPGDQEEPERGDQVQVADHLVVGGGQPVGGTAPGRRRPRTSARPGGRSTVVTTLLPAYLRAVPTAAVGQTADPMYQERRLAALYERITWAGCCRGGAGRPKRRSAGRAVPAHPHAVPTRPESTPPEMRVGTAPAAAATRGGGTGVRPPPEPVPPKSPRGPSTEPDGAGGHPAGGRAGALPRRRISARGGPRGARVRRLGARRGPDDGLAPRPVAPAHLSRTPRRSLPTPGATAGGGRQTAPITVNAQPVARCSGSSPTARRASRIASARVTPRQQPLVQREHERHHRLVVHRDQAGGEPRGAEREQGRGEPEQLVRAHRGRAARVAARQDEPVRRAAQPFQVVHGERAVGHAQRGEQRAVRAERRRARRCARARPRRSPRAPGPPARRRPAASGPGCPRPRRARRTGRRGPAARRPRCAPGAGDEHDVPLRRRGNGPGGEPGHGRRADASPRRRAARAAASTARRAAGPAGPPRSGRRRAAGRPGRAGSPPAGPRSRRAPPCGGRPARRRRTGAAASGRARPRRPRRRACPRRTAAPGRRRTPARAAARDVDDLHQGGVPAQRGEQLAGVEAAGAQRPRPRAPAGCGRGSRAPAAAAPARARPPARRRPGPAPAAR